MRRNRHLGILLWGCFILLAVCSVPAHSQVNLQKASAANSQLIPAVAADGAEAWLVTFGPGEAYWERFGHNAIWLREPAASLDHTFNFGFFDFEQEDFFLRFLRGKMMYFSVAQPAAREFEFYQQQNRSIRLQKLNLNAAEYRRLSSYLLNEIQPENRNYHYDYYLNNCSTRIRDAIDLALNGELANATEELPSALDFRGQTRRLTQSQFWYYLGLEIALGYPVDRPISQWDNMFIPMVVADQIANLGRPSGASLVSEELQLYISTLPPAPDMPSSVWLRYLFAGLLLAGLYWLSVGKAASRWVGRLSMTWALLLGGCGLGLGFLWLFTDHSVTVSNINVLLFNPLLLIALAPVMKRFAAVLLVAGVAISVALLLFARHQYNIDVLALLAPMNLSVAAYWLLQRNRIVG